MKNIESAHTITCQEDSPRQGIIFMQDSLTRHSYMFTHLSHAVCIVIGQLRTSPHQSEIEISNARKYMEELSLAIVPLRSDIRTTLCLADVTFSAIKRCCLFKQGFCPPPKVMEYKVQWHLYYSCQTSRQREVGLQSSPISSSHPKNNNDFVQSHDHQSRVA